MYGEVGSSEDFSFVYRHIFFWTLRLRNSWIYQAGVHKEYVAFTINWLIISGDRMRSSVK